VTLNGLTQLKGNADTPPLDLIYANDYLTEKIMAGVGKLMKQVQKMQKQMESVQAELAEKELTVSSGGGAVEIVITGQSEFRKLTIDPEFLKEDAEMVSETLLGAIQEASAKAKAVNEEAMGSVAGGMGGGLPGFM